MHAPALIAALALAAGDPQDPAHMAHGGHVHEGGLQWAAGPWSVMAHGFVNAIVDHQGSPRGDDKNFSNSMFMAVGSREVAGGRLELRSMLSLDPAMGKGGYPLLFQTGETANGRTHLIDRQHPHDFFMEMAARYEQPWAEGRSGFVYAGLPGEPALGPTAFMHRASGIRIPEAPLTHHWLDSTHITMGVVTLGVTQGAWTLEGSAFNGREPDQYRWNIETGRLDSHSARLSWRPVARWTLQASYGDIRDPEITTERGVRIRRTTVSAIYEGRVFDRKWATTFAFGQNDKSRERTRTRYRLPGWLFETTAEVARDQAAFMRVERITHDDAAIPLMFHKLSVGYIYDFVKTGPVTWGIGALGSWMRAAEVTRFFYGDRPTGYMVFLQARI